MQAVKLHIRDHHVTMDNGILKVTLSKPDGIVTAIKYNHIDNLLEIANDESNRGIHGTKFEVVVETEEQIELSFSRTWDTSLQGKLGPLNIDKRFVMLRGSSGFYSYAIYEHLEGWPAFNLDETRIVFKLRKDKFHYMAMADNRQRYMPLPDDRLPGRAQPLDYPEAVLLVNPVEPEFKGEVDDKYQYSGDNKDVKVHGWICEEPSVGFWLIMPSNEFRTGGPSKQDLTSHVGPVTLSMFVSAHYGGEDLVVKFGEGEAWKKVFGPVFVYLNSVAQGDNHLLLWEDAKQQVLEQIESWPYSFPASQDFPTSAERGNISGKLLVRDRCMSDDYMMANGAYIGLAPPGEIGSWQTEGKGYQFWTRTDEQGYFSINNIRTGEYNIYAWIPGFIGDFRHDELISIIPDDKAYQATTWQIKFNLDAIEPNGTYTLRLALASAAQAELQVRINNPNENPPLFTTGLIGKDNTIARHGIHGLYRLYNVGLPNTSLVQGDNTIYLTQSNATGPFQGVMYDYIRLEGPE
ncbi:hypothetical protein DH2020_035505 [Rehmannia glutinosa]|uniref:rhamnogalacturonan endolyase n=1 Tax=Rehmannia glutinosa TaxID=99300 RepID=A0ABR0V7E8_REHGL